MEINELATKRKIFMPSVDRYKYPHREAMRLRRLWNHRKSPNKTLDAQHVRSLYREACSRAREENNLETILPLVVKGLYLDPRFHQFHALRGDIYMQEGKWSRAILSYENARSMSKFDKKLPEDRRERLYNEILVESYKKRATWYYENELILESAADYEQILTFESPGISIRDVEDKLLETLMMLEKHETYEYYWHRFVKGVDSFRTSVLLAKRAKYKIQLKDLSSARRMLYRALDLDEKNAEAGKLLQVVFDTGHVMISCTVMWCMHGCYDKALMTIEKARDCDPYNPGYTVLKTLVLRLSGRLAEAEIWLMKVDKGFPKFLEPSRDTHGSVTGKLSIKDVRRELTNEWYLMRFEVALKHYLKGEYKKTIWMIEHCSLTKCFIEAEILLGDCFLREGNWHEALKMYKHCHERFREQGLGRSKKHIDVLERIIDILNRQANWAAEKKNPKNCIKIADEVLQLLNEGCTELHDLAIQRGRILMCKARGFLQMHGTENEKKSMEIMAESLRFARRSETTGLYRNFYSDMSTEEVIDRFSAERKFPYSLKAVLQYS